jgi:hypothetical protein
MPEQGTQVSLLKSRPYGSFNLDQHYMLAFFPIITMENILSGQIVSVLATGILQAANK